MQLMLISFWRRNHPVSAGVRDKALNISQILSSASLLGELAPERVGTYDPHVFAPPEI